MHFKELPIIKEQWSVNLNPFPASCLYESRGQQARPRLALALLNLTIKNKYVRTVYIHVHYNGTCVINELGYSWVPKQQVFCPHNLPNYDGVVKLMVINTLRKRKAELSTYYM